MIIIGVDTGGTFTDIVVREDETRLVHKVLSTPSRPEKAVLDGLSHVARNHNKKIVYGTTVATNAVLEGKGAKTALITNKGFEDIIAIGRQDRKHLYVLTSGKRPSLVPPHLRFGARGRIRHTGDELEKLDFEAISKIIDRLREAAVESVAVSLLFSYINPRHEQDIFDRLDVLGIPVSLSHEILAEFREYERTSTTVLNAYVRPKMAEHVGKLIESLEAEDRLSIMQSNGGSLSAETAMAASVRTVLSGPAGGAVGALEMGRTAGFSKIISFDMGGTSTDVCLIDGTLPLTTESEIAGYPIKVPVMDIHTVGAGGGSIVSLDPGGALKVGPESAGAHPGPICYGKGKLITVTDANLYLGRLIPEYFLGGAFDLYPERLEPFFKSMEKETGLSGPELAEGILTVANTAMEKAVRVISVERGNDPRDFALFSFGGAGGMHGAFLARMLNIPKVIIPPNPGMVSAMGMLLADTVKDYSLTVMKPGRQTPRQELETLFDGLNKRGLNDLSDEGITKAHMAFERHLDMRYTGQSYELMVPFVEDFIEKFHQLHEKAYGYRNPERDIDIVNIRLRARGIMDNPAPEKKRPVSSAPVEDAILGSRPVYFDRRQVNTRIIQRERLMSGNELAGPAIVVEYSSTIVIPPFAQAFVDGYGNIILDIIRQRPFRSGQRG
ncbi:MAG: hydantoinase/oxoprolinase family protein [Desulfobacterales bacterium]